MQIHETPLGHLPHRICMSSFFPAPIHSKRADAVVIAICYARQENGDACRRRNREIDGLPFRPCSSRIPMKPLYLQSSRAALRRGRCLAMISYNNAICRYSYCLQWREMIRRIRKKSEHALRASDRNGPTIEATAKSVRNLAKCMRRKSQPPEQNSFKGRITETHSYALATPRLYHNEIAVIKSTLSHAPRHRSHFRRCIY